MRRVALGALVAALLLALLGVALPARAEAPLMTWDATSIKGARYTAISCYEYGTPWSTWRSDSLPLAGSWEYRSSGSRGLYPDYSGEVACTIRAFDKRGNVVGYPAPVTWRFLP